MSQVILGTKLLGENKIASFYFTLPVGVTITSQIVAATVYSGVDPTPSSIISGGAVASGSVVTQKIGGIPGPGVTGGVLGVIYELLCTISTSDGQTLLQSAFLAIVPDLV